MLRAVLVNAALLGRRSWACWCGSFKEHFHHQWRSLDFEQSSFKQRLRVTEWHWVSFIFRSHRAPLTPRSSNLTSASFKFMPDIPHFIHAFKHVEHRVPRPICIVSNFPENGRCPMWLHRTFYPIGWSQQIGPHGLSSW
jgi:hypothetical protein